MVSNIVILTAKGGVREGDPLSPLLFCIDEGVLSKGILKLVEQGNLEMIKGTGDLHVPSHTLYPDEIMIFCKGKVSCIQALETLFTRYALLSSQVINSAKSTVYAGSMSNVRLDDIVIRLYKGLHAFHLSGCTHLQR